MTPPADALHALQLLQRRRSLGPKALRPPAPSPEQWQHAAELALRAPDHQALRPFRFVHVGDDERGPLGELFARAASEAGRDPADVAAARDRARAGPGLLAVVGRIRDDVDDVPPYEQWLTIGAGVMNLLNALHLMGFGAKVLSGSSVRSPAVRQAFCHAGEALLCWVVAGTPAEPPAAPDPVVVRDLLTDWSPRR